jgi:hypothetical protein
VTTRTTTFFRWVWRANAVLLLGTCIAALAAIAALSKSFFVGVDVDPPQTVTNVAGTDIGAEALELRQFEKVKGTQLMFAPLAAKADRTIESSASYAYGSILGTTRNLLFFDIETRNTHWLFTGNNQRIPSVAFITDPSSEDCGYGSGKACVGTVTTQAILLEIAPGPGAGPAPTTRRLAIASPDGRQLTTIASNADGLLGSYKTPTGSLLVFYSVAGAVRVAEIDVTSRSVRSDAELSAQNGTAR